MLKIYHKYSGNPGYRMLRVYLPRSKISLSNTTVLKYMRELKIRSVVRPKRLPYKKGDCYKKFENHLNREFHADRVNEKWCMDFTYILMSDGRKRYNCSIIDLIKQSMSRAGCPYDHSPMESFYGTFKEEFINRHRFSSDEELNNETLDYVYVYYNHVRPHLSNGYMTPFEKRTQT